MSSSASSPPEPLALSPLNLAERLSVSGLGSLKAALFTWAAIVLPWQVTNWFSWLMAALALSHAAVAVAVWLHAVWGQTLWKGSAIADLSVLFAVSLQVFTGGAYLAGLYGSLGEGLFAALIAIWGQVVLLTLPTSCWALVRTRHAPPRLGNWSWKLGTAAATLVIGSSSLSHGAAIPHTFADVAKGADVHFAELGSLLEELRFNHLAEERKGRQWRVSRRGPAQCDAPPEAAPVTLVATFTRAEGKGYASACVQDVNLSTAVEQLRGILVEDAAQGAVKLDLVAAVGDLGGAPHWLRMLALRPAKDGLCLGSSCWMPWQLLARDALSNHQPLDFIGDLKFGADLEALREQLVEAGAPRDGALRRIETHSWLVNRDGVHELSRLRPLQVDLNHDTLERASSAAQNHIVQAQLKDGKFRYLLHPFSQHRETRNFNLARQAGTLLVLCELGEDTPQVDQTIRDGLALLQRYERIDAARGLSGLSMARKPKVLALGDSALPLVAFISCRERVGETFDATLARLTRMVLASQRDDGSFAAAYDPKRGRALAGPEPLYAPGQSILALALLESRVRRAPEPTLPDAATLERARLEAMSHVAHEHWPNSLYPFFFIEENWNCLAARASLELVHEPAYEQFCFDYVTFKSRLILEEDSEVDADWVGGFGFGNVIPPHNTGAAGFGEALAAAIAVRQARQLPIEREREVLTKILGFLQRQQWTDDNCFGCDADALGSMSEHTHSAITRIDFVQHAWAAMGHGRRVLEL